MKKIKLYPLILFSFLLMKVTAQSTLPESNPFSKASSLQYQAPQFDKIKNEHFKPALEFGMQQQLDEIKAIAENKQPATFENTLVALEKTGQIFTRVNLVLGLITSANTNDELQALQEELAPKFAALTDAIFLNEKLFSRVKAIYAKKATLKLDNESKKLLEYYYLQFKLNGALLSAADKEIFKKYNEEEATINAKYTNTLMSAAKNGALVVNDVNQLKGLSESQLKTAQEKAKERGIVNGYLLPLKNTTNQPMLPSLEIRNTRELLFKASQTRCSKNDSNDTRKMIIRLANIRALKAKLLGYENYATWKLQDQMAKSPKAVDDFFARLIPAFVSKAKQEGKEIQALMDKQKKGEKLEPWDWDFYGEQVRKEKYSLDEAEVKPYFNMYTVLEKGVFYAAEKLYGLTFKERFDLPIYQEDVRVFEVMDNGKSFALLYIDFYKRDNKNGGAWMSNLVGQSYLLNTKPVIYNVCNFTKPAKGEPVLIGFDDVITMFHEFGHTLHGLFASQKYPSLSGTNTARDFVEFPSQFNEHWALEPSVLKNYAKHYKTGETISNELVKKIKNASSFNKGYDVTEAVAAANLDLQWHKLSVADASKITDADEFEKAALKKVGLDLKTVPPRYSSPYFLHIWSNGYAAGYYAYQWTKMLEEQAYQWFKKNGGMTKANGDKIRKTVLSKGSTIDYNKMFKNLTNQTPAADAMIEELDLK